MLFELQGHHGPEIPEKPEVPEKSEIVLIFESILKKSWFFRKLKPNNVLFYNIALLNETSKYNELSGTVLLLTVVLQVTRIIFVHPKVFYFVFVKTK